MRKDHFGYLKRNIFNFFAPILSDVLYANVLLLRWFGKGNVKHPKTFNEKIQWLKIFNRNPIYVQLADKYAVRDYVKTKIGEPFLNELIGVWSSPSEIEWDRLPEKFVLKCTHGSGMNILISDKACINQHLIQEQLALWLKQDYSKLGREWVYKNIHRKIIAEKYLKDDEGNVPVDYKFFCFNGVPKYVQVDIDRFKNHRRVFFDKLWQRQPFDLYYDSYDGDLAKPKYFELMLDVASKLSSNIPFVRVDLYAIPEVFFGEMTFYPGNGTEHFYPAEWDLILGDMLILPDAF